MGPFMGAQHHYRRWSVGINGRRRMWCQPRNWAGNREQEEGVTKGICPTVTLLVSDASRSHKSPGSGGSGPYKCHLTSDTLQLPFAPGS